MLATMKGISGRYSFAIAVSFLLLLPVAYGWGIDGHYIACSIAQSRLSNAAAAAVSKLLGGSEQKLADWCSWADEVKFRYHWSSPLHYINTPDSLCTYNYARDCKDQSGVKGRCVAGAINNYTSQLLGYSGSSKSSYNLTQALLFLSHFMGDIHQPLHVGFASDEGGNTIDVRWYRRKDVLHHVWDGDIIETEEKFSYQTSVDDMVVALQKNITGEWADMVAGWEACDTGTATCTDTYASESIKAACEWAYKDVSEGSVLSDPYFGTRAPIVNVRLAQAGVRLAAYLNRAFQSNFGSSGNFLLK